MDIPNFDLFTSDVPAPLGRSASSGQLPKGHRGGICESRTLQDAMSRAVVSLLDFHQTGKFTWLKQVETG